MFHIFISFSQFCNFSKNRNTFCVSYHSFYGFVNYLTPLWMPLCCCKRTMDTWWLNPNSLHHKFISQFQIDLTLKHLKILVSCQMKRGKWFIKPFGGILTALQSESPVCYCFCAQDEKNWNRINLPWIISLY